MIRRLTTLAVAVLVAAAAWILVWPAQFGGQASWLVVDGTALEPSFSDGDLVIAREQPTYPDGALVAADAGGGPELGLAGDVDGEILGSPWLHLAGAGSIMTAAAAVVLSWPFLLLAGVAGAVSIAIGRHRTTSTNEAAESSDQSRTAHTLAS